MIASIAVSLALTGAAHAAAEHAAVAHAPLATVDRLVAAAVARRGDGSDEALRSRLDRLEALRAFAVRAHQRILIGGVNGSDLFNFLQVERDLVETGSGLAVLPEERLCWQRAGLNLAYANYRVVSERVTAGALTSVHLDQVRAQFELFRTGYNRALAECVTTPR
jgi:hypothetical protein